MHQPAKTRLQATLKKASFETRLGTPACGGAARRLAPLRGAFYAAARRFDGACGALWVRSAHPYQHRKVAYFSTV